MRNNLLKTVGVLLLCIMCCNTFAQKEKVSVYFLDDPMWMGANVSAVSPNGKYVVTQSMDVYHMSLIWNLDSRKFEVITGSKDSLSLAYGVTNDGMVVGSFMDSTKYTYDGRKGCPVPGYWKEGKWTALPLMEGINTSGDWLDGFACAVSADGKQIAGSIQFGFGQYTPALWVDGVLQNTKYEGVELGQGGYCLAGGNDCKLLGGWAEHDNGARSPAVWKDYKMTRVLGETEDEVYFFDGQIRGISQNGKFAAGYFSLTGTGSDAYPFIWSEEVGTVKYVDSGIGSTVSNTGNVYGSSGYMGSGTIFKGGIQYDLANYLEENYDFDSSKLKYNLGTVIAISEDERVIGGWTVGGMAGGMPLMAPYIVVIEKANSGIDSNEFAGVDVRLSPNPVIDRLNIDGEFESASVYNSVGAEVIPAIRSNSADMSNFDQGVYFVKVTNGASSKTFKIVKK